MMEDFPHCKEEKCLENNIFYLSPTCNLVTRSKVLSSEIFRSGGFGPMKCFKKV